MAASLPQYEHTIRHKLTKLNELTVGRLEGDHQPGGAAHWGTRGRSRRPQLRPRRRRPRSAAARSRWNCISPADESRCRSFENGAGVRVGAARDRGHRTGGAGIRAARARSRARPVHPHRRRHGSAGDDDCAERCRRAAVAILRFAVHGQSGRGRRAVARSRAHRRAARDALGGAGRGAALRALRRHMDRGAVRHGIGGGGRSGVVAGHRHVEPVRDCRAHRRATGRTAALRPYHGHVAAVGGRRGDLLELAVGPDRAGGFDSLDLLSGGCRAPRQGAQPARYPARRQSGAHHAAAFLSARTVRGFRGDHRERPRFSQARFVRRVLRSRVDARAASRRGSISRAARSATSSSSRCARPSSR